MMQLLTFIVFTVHEYKSKLMGFECKKKNAAAFGNISL